MLECNNKHLKSHLSITLRLDASKACATLTSPLLHHRLSPEHCHDKASKEENRPQQPHPLLLLLLLPRAAAANRTGAAQHHRGIVCLCHRILRHCDLAQQLEDEVPICNHVAHAQHDVAAGWVCAVVDEHSVPGRQPIVPQWLSTHPLQESGHIQGLYVAVSAVLLQKMQQIDMLLPGSSPLILCRKSRQSASQR